MSGRFVAIGNMSIDDLVFADGSTKWAVPGGNAIYSALGMAVWGERPRVLAPRGPEYPIAVLGDRIDLGDGPMRERNLRNWGLYEEDGTRTFTFRTKTRNWIEYCPVPDDLGGETFAYCHIAPLPWSRQTEFAEALRAKGAELISVDLDDRYISTTPREDMIRLFRAIDVLLPSRQDVDAMFPGKTPLDGMRALRELAPELAADRGQVRRRRRHRPPRRGGRLFSPALGGRFLRRRDRRRRQLLRRRAGRTGAERRSRRCAPARVGLRLLRGRRGRAGGARRCSP